VNDPNRQIPNEGNGERCGERIEQHNAHRAFLIFRMGAQLAAPVETAFGD
jgi:hypothetical protein